MKRLFNDDLSQENTIFDFFEVRITEELLENLDYLKDILFDCQCVLLLIDITDSKSLDGIKGLPGALDFKNIENLKTILVENKIDDDEERKINSDIIDNFINEHNISDHIKISIKSGDNFQELFEKINSYVSNNNMPINFIYQNDIGNKVIEVEEQEGCINLGIILLGNSMVGKTSFFNRIHCNLYQENLTSTIGVDSITKYYKYKNSIYKLTLYDTAGQDKYRALPKAYYQKCDGLLLMFDITNEDSFNGTSLWLDDVKECNPNNDKLVVYLVGNKIDDFENRVIKKEDAEKKASELKFNYYEISCKLNININEVLIRMINSFIQKFEKNIDDSSFTNKKISKQTNSKNKNCC